MSKAVTNVVQMTMCCSLGPLGRYNSFACVMSLIWEFNTVESKH